MKIKLFIGTLIGLVFLNFVSCSLDNDFEEGKIPVTPVNIEQANSEFDDYNMASPYYLYNEFPLLFSTNRATQGGTFDFINFIAQYFYNSETNEFSFYVDTAYGYWFYDSALVKINTDYNEFGPLVILASDNFHFMFFYATDETGDLDINFIQADASDAAWGNPSALSKINSTYNDAYPTFNQAYTEIYWCSDSTGDFDIYKASLPQGTSLLSWLKMNDEPEKMPCTDLNSSGNDKCPYFIGDLMVFTSDRPGGYGGYDLYYSIYKNKTWSAPVNFGPEINSEYDEYRPVAIYANNYKNDLMIFSSNRPGGKGGFDLYYVGIPKLM